MPPIAQIPTFPRGRDTMAEALGPCLSGAVLPRRAWAVEVSQHLHLPQGSQLVL